MTEEVEECFGRLKSVAGMGRNRVGGRWKLRQLLEVLAAAFNLVRMRRLAPAAVDDPRLNLGTSKPPLARAVVTTPRRP